MKRLIIVGAALAALLAGPANAGTPTPASGATWAANQKVEYRWKGDAEPPGWLKPAINAAAADSNNSRASRAAIFSYKAGADSWILRDSPSSNYGDDAVLKVDSKAGANARAPGSRREQHAAATQVVVRRDRRATAVARPSSGTVSTPGSPSS
jgi:hypothetical protein